MSELDASFLSPKDKRAAVERGNSIYYPWAGNSNSLKWNAADIMGPSSTKYTTRLDLAEGWQEQADLVHKAWIIPLSVNEQSLGPVTSELIILPDQQ